MDSDSEICQNNVCAEAQHVVSLIITGSVSCLFINKRVQCVSLLFHPGVIAVHNQPVPVVAGK